MDERNTLLERQAAWDYLLDRAHDYVIRCLDPNGPQLDDIPPPLAVWCMMIATGHVKPPKWGRGRPSMLSALLARKTPAVGRNCAKALPAVNNKQSNGWRMPPARARTPSLAG